MEDEHKSVMHRIRLEKHPPPRKSNPGVPRELERIIGRCLEKRKMDRFRSTQDLVLALERFISKQVEINYHARLVLFLRDQKVLTASEAEAQLHPAVAGGYKTPTLQPAISWSGVKRLASVHAAILGATAIAVAFIHASQLGSPIVQAAPMPLIQARQSGFLKIVADPWAHVYVDGKLLDTTPFSHPLTLPEGEHTVQLKNPYFIEQQYRVTIRPNAATVLRASLTRK